MLSLADQAAWTDRIRTAASATGVTPQQVQRDQVEYVDFHSYFKDFDERLLMRQKSIRRAYLMLWLKSALYYSGKQILVPRTSGFGYDIRQITGIDDPLWVYNKLRPYSDEVTSMWVQSSPEILLAVLDEDDRKATRAQNEIELLNKYFNYLHFTEENLQTTAQMGQFCGNYSFELWFDKDASNGFEWVEEYAPLSIPSSMWYECLEPNCQQVGEMPVDGKCQYCSSQSISPVPMPAVDMPNAIPTKRGWEKKGEVMCRPFPFWSQAFSFTTGPSNSPWRYAEEDQPKELIECRYGKLPGTACDQALGIEEEMHPERVMRRAERIRTGIVEGEDDQDNVLTQRFWYEPEMLAYLAPKEDVQMPNGEVIPARTRLNEAFPNGMCRLTAPGMPQAFSITRESHLKRFIDGRYGITFGSKVGHGNEDGVVTQKQYNILMSGKFRYLQKTLQPSIAVNNKVFPNARLFNRVDNVITTNNQNIPEGTRIQDHFAIISAPPLNPQLFAVEEAMDANMQAALKAYNSEGDFAGVENSTATASKIGESRNARGHGLHLALYAGTLKEVAIRRLEIAQENYQNLRLVAVIDSLSGQRQVATINNVSLQTQIVAWVKTGSYLPNLEMEKRASFVEAVNVATLLAGINMLNPASLQSINNRFQTDLTFQKLNERQEECDEILDMMLQMFQQMQGMVTPEMLYALNPVNPATLGHDAKLQWWREFLTSKEGRTAPQQIQQAAEIYVGQEYQALAIEQAYIASLANVSGVVTGLQQGQVAAATGQDEQGKPGDKKAKGKDNPMASDPTMAVAPNPMMGPS